MKTGRWNWLRGPILCWSMSLVLCVVLWRYALPTWLSAYCASACEHSLGDGRARAELASWLTVFPLKRAAPGILAALGDESGHVRSLTHRYLVRATGQDVGFCEEAVQQRRRAWAQVIGVEVDTGHE